ncbi:MAG: response regulator [Acidobacteria bacterium]|nr:MAG: response regulator [Acidobacteriota bacterium]
MSARQQALLLLAGQAPAGRDFFEVASQALCLGLDCRWAGVGRRSADGRQVELLAFWDGDGAGERFAYPLAGSPCEALYRDPAEPHLFVPRAVAERFPSCAHLAQLGARSYRGALFRGRQAAVHVFALGDREQEDGADERAFIGLVSQRVGAEYERWRAERALKASEATLRRYRSMMAAVSDQMLFIDRSYTLRALNPRFLEAVGNPPAGGPSLEPRDLIGRPVAEIYGDAFFATELKPDLDHCLAGNQLHVQRWFEPPGGEPIYLDLRYYPHRDEDGAVGGVVVIARDVTRRQQDQKAIVALARHEAVVAGDVERAARRITETAAARLEVARTGVWLFDEDRRILRLVDLFERDGGLHSAGAELQVEAYPRYFAALERGRAVDAHDARNDPRTRELDDGYLAEHRIVSMLDAPIRVAGEVAGVLCHEHVGSPRVWQADEVVFASEAADQMAQTLMNRERHVLAERLYQAQKMESLGVLAGGIAHDFNNLLVGILGGADLALPTLPEDAPARRHIATIHKAASRASELCNQMLAYAGKGRLELRRIDLSELVANTLPLIESSLDKNATLRPELADGLPAIEADVTQVRQVIMNLLTNAADALDDRVGEVLVRTSLRTLNAADFDGAAVVPAEPAGRFVVLEVRDTGRGMDRETQARIFDPFFSTKTSGRGLGLAAALGIVRGHGGGIRVASAPGRGTVFEIFFPAQEEAGDPLDETVTDRRPPVARRDGRVLVVDDEAMVREVAAQMLEAGGFEVLAASDGYEALALYGEHGESIDAVLLDVSMPQMDGAETLRALRRIDPGVVVILSSGYPEQEAALRFAELKPSAFLHKPYKVQTLLRKVAAALAAP